MEAHSTNPPDPALASARLRVYVLVTLAGLAALSWELLWQLEASLALGVSALGTAITLAATMGGMTIGALLAGRVLSARSPERPLRVYAGLELVIGVSGLLVLGGFALLERIDSRIWSAAPALAPYAHLLGIVALLGPPTMAMGATVPVFGLVARRHGTSIAVLYGLNTGGAALGVLLAAFVVIPMLGVSTTVRAVACLNVLVAAACWLLRAPVEEIRLDAASASWSERRAGAPPQAVGFSLAMLAVATTGFVTFALEVAWFRSMRSAFQSTTESFAIILASVLVPLAVAARMAPWLRRRGHSLGPFLVAGGFAVLLATPAIERIDLWRAGQGVWGYAGLVLSWFGLALAIVGPPILLLGVAVPWLLEEQAGARRWARLYGINTLGAIVGALAAAWVLLPRLGVAPTSWLAGGLAGVVGLLTLRGRAGRVRGGALLLAALAVAYSLESGIGRLRVQSSRVAEHRVIASTNSADSTVSVIELLEQGGLRALLIDGFQASSERGARNYMTWMGRLPMLAHPRPERALVICFGTGQTANAVRREGSDALDIVDINAAVFGMADRFPTNEGVLDADGVRAITMDGRAWLRRTDERYDVVTLEPMPPYFAGSNALYSREFYALIERRLRPGGIVAQWVPFHLLAPELAASTVATFADVFPDSLLWLDPFSGTGVVVGRHGSGAGGPSWDWPGFAREAKGRNLTRDQVAAAVLLGPRGVARYAALGEVITDDNQLLSYGGFRALLHFTPARLRSRHLALLQEIAAAERADGGL